MSSDVLDTSWMVRAACKGMTHLFYPPHTCWHGCRHDCQAGRLEQGRFERIRRARELCDSCPVKELCREWALESREPHGIIAGLTEDQRKALIKEREAGTQQLAV